MTKNQIHEWRERGEDGVKRKYRGYWDSRQWRFALLEPDFEDWEPVEEPGIEVWKSLRDVIWRKYQRKRLPYKFLEGLDATIAEMEEVDGAGQEEPS
jgi:hypothetical protein